VLRETIALDVGERHVPYLDTIVDPLVVTDLPTVAWLPDHADAAVGPLLVLAQAVMIDSVEQAELDKTKDLLIDMKPHLRGYSSDTITNMTSGNAWIQHLWNGDVVNIRNQVDSPENFKFQKCDEGIPVGSDTFAIPVNAKHPGTALLFIEYMLDPENQASNVEWVGYPMPYEGGAAEAFAGLVKEDPEIDVTVDDLSNGQQFENLKGEGRRAWDRVWTEVKVA
jgi:spermidine/putrescine transport system substrate-binding protein